MPVTSYRVPDQLPGANYRMPVTSIQMYVKGCYQIQKPAVKAPETGNW